MKRLISYIAFICALMAASAFSVQSESIYEEELGRIDQALEHSEEYVRAKQQKISTIENMLNSRGVTPLQQYHIYRQLFLEYKPFQFDKAKETLEYQLVIAKQIANDSLLHCTILGRNVWCG